MLERGFDKMTVDDVAAKAGVGKATVYRRWPSKDDLAVAAMEQLLTVEFPMHDTGSIAEDLRLGYVDILSFANSPEGEAFLRMSIAESIRDERIASAYRASIERREEHARQTFQRAIERGELRPDFDVDATLQWLGGLLILRAVTRRAMPPVELADTLVAMTLRGIRAPER